MSVTVLRFYALNLPISNWSSLGGISGILLIGFLTNFENAVLAAHYVSGVQLLLPHCCRSIGYCARAAIYILICAEPCQKNILAVNTS